ncbi:MAG: HEAT repeat domain-containing protein [bacterium]|nr:HEAT repeat domain-containing protein [bacterium]
MRYWPLVTTIAFVITISTAISAEEGRAGATPTVEANADSYGGAYTPAELAALDKALWTQNLTRTDLKFDKDFGKGHECFPIVREMMADPLRIGPHIDHQFSLFAPIKDRWYLRDITQAALGLTPNWWFKSETEPWPQANVWAASGPAPLDAPGLEGVKSAAMQIISRPSMGGPSELTTSEFRNWFLHAMAWHPVDSAGAAIEDVEASSKDNFELASQLNWKPLASGTANLMAETTRFFREGRFSTDYFPNDAPLVIDTEGGRICLGTPNDDTYTGDFAVLIDPGGNDTYKNCRIGAAYGKATPELGEGRVGYFVDLGGDDFYDCGDVDITLGAALLGVAAFYDLGGGNDRYYAGSVSLGAAIGGVATFYDDDGSDYYSGKVYTQGAAGFGIAVMCDDSVGEPPVIPSDIETPDPIDMAAMDNDHYTAWCEAQGFARTRGIAICTNARGNEVYHAGGVYLDAPLFTDRYASFSQGFAIGERQIDYAGGIALLADYDGNDRYLGDVYNQGVGYWYSAGFLYDGGGNDHYEMTQYGQGSGIHLAVGGLIDEAGSDTYIMNNGLGQGGSHDYAASVFMDRGGDDRYFGSTSCNGCGLTNSVGLFFDRGGNDVYAGKRDALNTGRPARGFGSIGVLVDLGGTDDYLGRMRDDSLWAQPQYGMGLDVGEVFGPLVGILPEEKREGAAANAAGFDKPSEGLKLPDVFSYEGPLTQQVFDELWELAIRWEVGDNRVIVPEARKKLVSFGADVLPLVAARMGDVDTGLALRAQVDVIKGVLAALKEHGGEPAPAQLAAELYNFEIENASAEVLSATAAVYAILATQLVSGEDARIRNALQIIAELKLTDMGETLAALLDSPDPAVKRRAVSVIGQIGSHAADEKLLALLDDATAYEPRLKDEKLLKVVVESAISLELDLPHNTVLHSLLEHESFAVRDTLVQQLALHQGAYGEKLHLLAALYSGIEPVQSRRLRSIARVYLAAQSLPPAMGSLTSADEVAHALSVLFHVEDAGVRSDAHMLAQHWLRLSADQPEVQQRINKIVASATALTPIDTVLNIAP